MTFKQVILVGLIVLMLESIAGYVYLTYRSRLTTDLPLPSSSPAVSPFVRPASKPTLALRTNQVITKKGQTIPVEVILEPNGHKAVGVDLTIQYDPTALSLIATGSANPFSESRVFQKTFFDDRNPKQGLASMSAISDTEHSIPDMAVFTSMMFKALKVGPTEITIVFTPGETRDTNIISETKDILGSVENLPITIQP